MSLVNYDFYDLYALLIFFRADTDKISEYAAAIEELVTCLEQSVVSKVSEYNTIRKILQSYVSEEEQGLSWIWTENVYTGHIFILKNVGYYCIMAEVFREMLRNLDDGERLWWLCNSTHNLPTLLAEGKDSKKAIKSIIRIYQMKYNKDFLMKELKAL